MANSEIDTSWDELGFLELPSGAGTSGFVIFSDCRWSARVLAKGDGGGLHVDELRSQHS